MWVCFFSSVLRYARVEEQFGLSHHVLAVFDRAVKVVPEKARLAMYRLYVKKVK